LQMDGLELPSIVGKEKGKEITLHR
jgi:hypothetical protein